MFKKIIGAVDALKALLQTVMDNFPVKKFPISYGNPESAFKWKWKAKNFQCPNIGIQIVFKNFSVLLV